MADAVLRDAVASPWALAAPGGRITGISQLITELPAQRLEVGRELVPQSIRLRADRLFESAWRARDATLGPSN